MKQNILTETFCSNSYLAPALRIFPMCPLTTSFYKWQFKGLSVYVSVCGTGFTCLYTENICHNELRMQTCGESKHK